MLDRYLDQAPRWLRSIEHDLREHEGMGDGVAAAVALAGGSRAMGATLVAELAERLEADLRRHDPGAREALVATRAAVDGLTDAIRDRRAAGWPAGGEAG